MAYFVLVLSCVACAATWVVFARIAAPAPISDTLFFCGPLLVLGIYFFLVSRVNGLRDPDGFLVPLRVGLLSAWIPNFVILVALSFYFYWKSVNFGMYRLDETLDYLVVFAVWILSIVTGAIGAGGTRIVLDRQEARRKREETSPSIRADSA